MDAMKVIVIGAGATGLTVAYLLARTGVRVTVLEAASRPGGLLATFDTGDGHLLEQFYHHFFTHDTAGQLQQKLLVIRLSQTQHDDMFAPGSISPMRELED